VQEGLQVQEGEEARQAGEEEVCEDEEESLSRALS
jgi:hypothetical protein